MSYVGSSSLQVTHSLLAEAPKSEILRKANWKVKVFGFRRTNQHIFFDSSEQIDYMLRILNFLQIPNVDENGKDGKSNHDTNEQQRMTCTFSASRPLPAPVAAPRLVCLVLVIALSMVTFFLSKSFQELLIAVGVQAVVAAVTVAG